VTTLGSDLYLLVAAYGLAIAVSYVGLPVLGQGAFVAIGAFGTAQLAAHGTPLGVAVLASVALAAVAGYAVGFAASRLEGAPLALATWGLAWLEYTALVVFPRVSGGSQGLTRPTPARLVSPALGVAVTLQPWVHVVLAGSLAVAAAAALWRAGNGPWGLDWSALRTGPALADSLGIPVQRRRRAALAASAALGAVGGAGTAVLLGVVAPTDYSPLLSLQLFVAVLVGGTANWWGPAVGVALLAALPSTADAIAGTGGIDPLRARAVLTALLLVSALGLRRPLAQRVGLMFARRVDPSAVVATVDATPTPMPTPMPLVRDEVLVALVGVTTSYGAVRALDNVDLDLRAGEVHALVGPNGSGKSTALRVASGVLAADAGRVVVSGSAVKMRGGAAPRVRAGVVRTLQRTASLGRLPVRRQVEVGARARDRLPLYGVRHLLGTRGARTAAIARGDLAAHALRLTGLDGRDALPAARLDSAEQRMLQVARAVATGAKALLLDEPAAGMSQRQREQLARVLRRLAAEGHGILLVEHDMHLVGRVADRVTVLAEGHVLATGSATDVRADPAVTTAYLGTTET
jgi:ABC-type branched-subunit amino acid transport system ATPase component/ABC-type branched-subunit amino acid transport system permease subunit